MSIETKTDLKEIQCTGRFTGSLVILSDRSVYFLVEVEILKRNDFTEKQFLT